MKLASPILYGYSVKQSPDEMCCTINLLKDPTEIHTYYLFRKVDYGWWVTCNRKSDRDSWTYSIPQEDVGRRNRIYHL